MHHINVNGDDVPYPIETLSELIDPAEFKKLSKIEYPKQVIENLKPYKFEELTAIQMQAIPVMLNVDASLLTLTRNSILIIYYTQFKTKIGSRNNGVCSNWQW